MNKSVIIACFLIFAGLYLLVPGEWLGIADKGFGSGVHLEWGDDFLVVVKGTIPPVIILTGIVLLVISRE